MTTNGNIGAFPGGDIGVFQTAGGNDATGTPSLPAFTLSGTATRILTSTGTPAFPAFTLSSVAIRELTSAGALNLPSITLSATAVRNLIASGAVDLTAFELSGVANLAQLLTATGSLTLTSFTLTSVGTIGRKSSGAIDLNTFVLDGDAYVPQALTSSGTLNLPHLQLDGFASIPVLIPTRNALDIIKKAPQREDYNPEFIRWLERNFSIVQELMENGATGSYTTADSKTVNVTNGIITSITT